MIATIEKRLDVSRQNLRLEMSFRAGRSKAI